VPVQLARVDLKENEIVVSTLENSLFETKAAKMWAKGLQGQRFPLVMSSEHA
jgi:hypothetical protein